MQKRGYPVFPSRFLAMEKLTLRAIRMAKELTKRQLSHLGSPNIHPQSVKNTNKRLGKIQTKFLRIGLEGDWEIRVLTPHEIDAVTATLTEHLYIQGETELIGVRKEGYIIVPSESYWRNLQL